MPMINTESMYILLCQLQRGTRLYIYIYITESNMKNEFLGKFLTLR